MFHVIMKQFIHGYSPMQVAGSIDEAKDLIASLENVPRSAVSDNGDYCDPNTTNVVRCYAVDVPSRGRRGSEYYKVESLHRS